MELADGAVLAVNALAGGVLATGALAGAVAAVGDADAPEAVCESIGRIWPVATGAGVSGFVGVACQLLLSLVPA